MAPRTTDRKIERVLDWINGFHKQRVDLLKGRIRLDEDGKEVLDKHGKKVLVTITDMPLPVLMCFLYIASHDGCNNQDIAEAFKMSPAAVSRNTDWLCAKRSLSEPGMNLITKSTDPCNKRFKVLQLTQLGKDQVKLFHLMNG